MALFQPDTARFQIPRAKLVTRTIDPQGEIVATLSHQAAHIRKSGTYSVALYAGVLPNAITPLDKLLEDPNNNVAGRATLSAYGKLANTSVEKIDALTKR